MPEPRKFLTLAKDFNDVSRGDPVPHKLRGEALVAARLTQETWRLEITADDKVTLTKPRKLDDGTAIDFAALLELGKTAGVKFLKAMQCNNIARPLGQGIWEGVPLRDVLRLAGKLENARRCYFWGFHNNDPKQMFRSSLAIGQVFDSPPGELLPFVAYRLNGQPIPLERGGPVRMVVPWAHGFKSIKWLQRIVLTNDHQANDTYAAANNDPESYLKTAAYFDSVDPETFPADKPITLRGTAMVGWPGLKRVEYWLRPDAGAHGKIDDDDPAWKTAQWQPCVIDAPPTDWGGGLPEGVLPKDVWGFDEITGKPKAWPLRYAFCLWSVTLMGLKPGGYELRVRTIDGNNVAQPEPRPGQKSGRNGIQCKQLVVRE
jgi:DMSO/TMAO reductase YedYZ molybdopterin-dependent catalytic subunit